MKLKYDKLPSTFAFKFKLRHYTAVEAEGGDALSGAGGGGGADTLSSGRDTATAQSTGAAADGGDGSDGGAGARIPLYLDGVCHLFKSLTAGGLPRGRFSHRPSTSTLT